MKKIPTETALRYYRNGPTQAERLCAAVLQLEGFKDVDPQCPLGGPDGRKDILCVKDSLRWVAAAYFPSTHSVFANLKKKFKHDLLGVKRNEAGGIVFLTNQRLTPGDRSKLVNLAAGADARAEIYHLERLCSVLDSPLGYGVRLEYLRIGMTKGEQVSYFAGVGEQLTHQLAAHCEKVDRALAQKPNQTPDERPARLNEDFFLKVSSLTGLLSLLIARHSAAYERTFLFSEIAAPSRNFDDGYSHGFLVAAAANGYFYFGQDDKGRFYIRFFEEEFGKKIRRTLLGRIDGLDDEDFRRKMKAIVRDVDDHFGHLES